MNRDESRHSPLLSSPIVISDSEPAPRKRENQLSGAAKIEERKERKPVKPVKKENYDTSPEPPRKRQAPAMLNDTSKKARATSYSSSEESDDKYRRPAKPKAMRTKLGAALATNQASVSNSFPEKTSKEPAKESAPVIAASAPTPVGLSRPKLTTEQREGHNQLLMLKMTKWAQLARKRKHESDKYSKTKPLVAGVVAMDALLVYIVAFDYEDRAEQVMRRPKHTRSWSTLIPYIGWLIGLLEEGDCRHLIGLCYQIRALIHLRMHTSLSEQINKLIEKEEGRKFSDLAELTTKLMKSQESSVLDFKRGVRDLGIDKLELTFPKTWKQRDRSVQPLSKHEGGYRPLEDPYYLPLHSFSSLQEAAALGYAITKEWADKNDIECDWALARGLKP